MHFNFFLTTNDFGRIKKSDLPGFRWENSQVKTKEYFLQIKAVLQSKFNPGNIFQVINTYKQ